MEVVTIQEAAKILGYSVGSLRKMRLEDRGPESILRAGKVCYTLKALGEWQFEQDGLTSRGGVMRRTVKDFSSGFVE